MPWEDYIEQRGDPPRAGLKDGPYVATVVYYKRTVFDVMAAPGAMIGEALGLSEEQASAALGYYTAHPAEIDATIEEDRRLILEHLRNIGPAEFDTDVASVQRPGIWLHGADIKQERQFTAQAAERLLGSPLEPPPDEYRWLPPAASLGMVFAIWALAWVLFGLVHWLAISVGVAFLAAGTLVAGNLALVFGVLLHPDSDLPNPAVFTGFVFTFVALIGAYAFASLVASHTGLVHPVLNHTYDCYYEGTAAHWLHGLDAVYVALGTLTTAGSGELVAHGKVCDELAVGELAVGFPILGLAIAGVAARIFAVFSSKANARRR